MEFKRTNWKNNDPSTPLSAANMNKIEDAIVQLIEEIDSSRAKEEALGTSLAHLREIVLALPTKEFVLQAIKEALGGSTPDIPDTPDTPDVPEEFYVNVVSDTNGAIILEGTYYHVVSDTNGYIVLN